MRGAIRPAYDDGLLVKGQLYTVGTNDGVQFKRIEFVGNKLLNGKTILVFSSSDNKQITINPSFHTFTMEDDDFPNLTTTIQVKEEKQWEK